jgi:hypothetical protein
VRNLRSALVLLLIIVLGLSLAVVPENLPETAFRESEMQPYVSTLLFSIVVLQVSAWAAEDERVPAHPDSDSLAILDCSLRC